MTAFLLFLSPQSCQTAHDHRSSSDVSYLMQLLGSLSQSILHMNLSQCSQPIVGFSARPLSNASAVGLIKTRSARRHTDLHIVTFKLDTFCTTMPISDCVWIWIYFLVYNVFSPPPLDDWRTSGPLESKCVYNCPIAFHYKQGSHALMESGENVSWHAMTE